VGAEFSGVERWIAGSPIRTPDTRKDSLAHALCCLATENWQLATENWQLATENWQLATGNWQLATGNWQLATGNWQLKTEN
jgi:hypothetical protein